MPVWRFSAAADEQSTNSWWLTALKLDCHYFKWCGSHMQIPGLSENSVLSISWPESVGCDVWHSHSTPRHCVCCLNSSIFKMKPLYLTKCIWAPGHMNQTETHEADCWRLKIQREDGVMIKHAGIIQGKFHTLQRQILHKSSGVKRGYICIMVPCYNFSCLSMCYLCFGEFLQHR